MHCCQQCVRALVVLHPCHHSVVLVFFFPFIDSNGSVVLLCISLMTDNVKHLFISLFTTNMSSLVKGRLVVFLVLGYESF